jgi:hypothetical protein
MKRLILPLGLALASAGTLRAGFSPVPINPASFNQDVVVEAASPIPLNGAVNATMDAGTNKAGDTWYERGYNTNAPTTGIPTAGSIVTNSLSTGNYVFRMPPDYHVNNVIMVGHNNGGRTPLLNPGAFTVTPPSAFTGLSFLTSAGNGPVIVGYTLQHDDGSVESATFSAPDWFNNTNYIFNAAGRVNIGGGGIDNLNGNPAGAVYGVNVTVLFPAGNITNITLYYSGSGGNGNTNNNGRAVIFAVSGALGGSTDYTNTLAVTGYNYDAVVEADGPQTTGVGVGTGTNLLNNVTATMDGGTSKANNCWFERGYYAAVPTSGLPTAGSSFTSATLPATYTMPASYATNDAVLLAQNVTNANILLSSPAAYGRAFVPGRLCQWRYLYSLRA